MENKKLINYLKDVLKNMPSDWLNLTTHRLDIYDEKHAKTQFTNHFNTLFELESAAHSSLDEIPTAYDYIRLGHPLSCVLEWAVSKLNNVKAESVISFSSQTTPIFSVLRKNLLERKKTLITYTDELPGFFNADIIKNVYGYYFELKKVKSCNDIPAFNGSTIYITPQENLADFNLNPNIDFQVNSHPYFGSIILVNGDNNRTYISEIQHVRRRETIAMTPINCFDVLNNLVGNSSTQISNSKTKENKTNVEACIKEVTKAHTKPLVGSSGLSIQYAIMMGLIHDAQENHRGKAIKFVVPPNCYGGTNDQARRVAACNNDVQVVDLPVDGDNDMVQSIDKVLDEIAKEDAIPCIIAEIPTNPRVEVPDMIALRNVLAKERKTSSGSMAINPIFILDQTFCPNVLFLGEGAIQSSVRAISYASGSKFPSGGMCTAGYCIGNNKVESVMHKIELHLELCDNEATHYQYEILARQMPSMNQRITNAYINTREFVNYIKETLPTAKINFVSEELTSHGFTPSVFSLDLPAKGESHNEREAYKRKLNHKLIGMMITEIPTESKYCVSYGQLKGCYWTIPATSTQGTTKESDKDYIARVALSANMDLDKHKAVFKAFVDSL